MSCSLESFVLAVLAIGFMISCLGAVVFIIMKD